MTLKRGDKVTVTSKADPTVTLKGEFRDSGTYATIPDHYYQISLDGVSETTFRESGWVIERVEPTAQELVGSYPKGTVLRSESGGIYFKLFDDTWIGTSTLVYSQKEIAERVQKYDLKAVYVPEED